MAYLPDEGEIRKAFIEYSGWQYFVRRARVLLDPESLGDLSERKIQVVTPTRKAVADLCAVGRSFGHLIARPGMAGQGQVRSALPTNGGGFIACRCCNRKRKQFACPRLGFGRKRWHLERKTAGAKRAGGVYTAVGQDAKMEILPRSEIPVQ
jgi:hypothetical protein